MSPLNIPAKTNIEMAIKKGNNTGLALTYLSEVIDWFFKLLNDSLSFTSLLKKCSLAKVSKMRVMKNEAPDAIQIIETPKCLTNKAPKAPDKTMPVERMLSALAK